jgi:hypothetical protein
MKSLPLLFALILLSGCAQKQGTLTAVSPEKLGELALDGSKAMRIVWPPSTVTLKKDVLQRAEHDPFLQALATNLHRYDWDSGGYNGSDLNYLIDRVDPATYRLTLIYDGKQRISRLYADTAGPLKPVSAWTREQAP